MTDGDFVGIRVWFFPNCEVGMIGLFGIRGRGEREGRLWVFRMVSNFLGAVLLGTLDIYGKVVEVVGVCTRW